MSKARRYAIRWTSISRIHSAFLIEGNLNLVVDQLNEFLLAPNTTVRLQLRNQIIQHLDKIER
jgi:two-component system phosphoglycerate transport system sensor histidine kinase PgtB